MANRVFDRETLLDLAVNLIPMAMIVFFFVLFVLFDPFPENPVAVGISLGLLVVPFVVLAIITYVSGRIIAEADVGGTSATASAIAGLATGMDRSDED